MISFSEPVSIVYPVSDFVQIGDGATDPRGTVTYRYDAGGVRVSYLSVGTSGGGWSRRWSDEPSTADVGDWIRATNRGVNTRVVRADMADIAARFFRRTPMIADQLLADPTFRRLAREAAEKNKTYSSDLLEYEKKAVVVEAVKVVAAEVAAERAEAARVAAEVEAARLAKLAAEAPVRDAVTDAYESCGYRTAAQGHDVSVVIGDRVGVKAEMVAGDRYSSRCTYRKMESHHTLFVRPDWCERVAAVGPALFGDAKCPWALVLDAKPLGLTPDDRPVYRLTVVRQAAGTGLQTETVEVTSTGEKWERVGKRETVAPMPAAILADYLEDRDAVAPETAAAWRK